MAANLTHIFCVVDRLFKKATADCSRRIQRRIGQQIFESDRPGFKLGHLVILDGVSHFYRTAADLAIFKVGLSLHGGVEHHRYPFRAVWAREEILHSTEDKGLADLVCSPI